MFVYSVRLVYDGFRPGIEREKNGGKGVQLRLVKHKRGLPLRIVQGAAPADASVLDGSHRYGTSSAPAGPLHHHHFAERIYNSRPKYFLSMGFVVFYFSLFYYFSRSCFVRRPRRILISEFFFFFCRASL